MNLKVEQCLHGYGDGHQRLATSVALTDAEAYRLDRMSDLSGYPGKQDPPPYLTGYPCGRWYVVARTWIDAAGERRGTVFTHSILVPASEICSIRDLRTFANLFRQPTHPVDPRRWANSLSVVPIPEPKADPVASAAWFEAETPLVWTGEAPEETVRSVWASLPASERADFRFCTYALLPRYLDERPFDWIAAPRQLLVDYGSARQLLRERDHLSQFPPWLLGMAWPPSWDAIEEALPGLTKADRRAALRYWSLVEQGTYEALLGAADLLPRLRAAVGSQTATALMRRLLQSVPASSLATLQDVLARDPLRWAPELEDLLCSFVHASVIDCAKSIDEHQLQRVLALDGSVGRSAKDAVRQCAQSWSDDQIQSRLARYPELAGDWILRLPPNRRRALVEGATGSLRALLVGDLRALEMLVEPGDPAWIDIALAIPGERAERRELRRVLERIGSPTLILWAEGRSHLATPVMDVLASEDAVLGVLRCSNIDLIEAVLHRVDEDELRGRLRLEPSAGCAAWRTLRAARDPAVGRSRIARSLLAVDENSTLLEVLAEEEEPLSNIRERDLGIVVGAVLLGALRHPPGAHAAAIAQHPAVAEGLNRLPRRDLQWLQAEADVGAAVAWLSRHRTIPQREPGLILDLVRAWVRRGWPPEVGNGLATIVNDLPSDHRLRAAGHALEVCLQKPRSGDLSVVEATFSIVHGALLADKNVFEGLRDFITSHWDKAKRPRRKLLRVWEEMNWPPQLLESAFPNDESWRHLINDLDEGMSEKGLRRFLCWLQVERPERFRALPSSLRAVVPFRGTR